jgi:hypothetical protein
MVDDEINKFNLIKKTNFFLKTINLTKTGKKKLEVTLVILKRKTISWKANKNNVEG